MGQHAEDAAGRPGRRCARRAVTAHPGRAVTAPGVTPDRVWPGVVRRPDGGRGGGDRGGIVGWGTGFAILGAVAEKKPRIFQDSRDMIISLVVCFAVILLAVSFTGLCSFNPRQTIESGPVRPVDAETILGMEAKAMPFPVRLPDTPDGWVANAARRTNVDGDSAPIVGWVTANKAYLQFLQTRATVDAVVDDFDDVLREEVDPVVVGEVTWRRFVPVDQPVKDTIYGYSSDEVTWIVTGTAGREEFSLLAQNIAAATPIEVAHPAADTPAVTTPAPAP